MPERRPMTPQDIAGLVDVADPRLSPDATAVAYVVTTVDLDANTYRGQIWLAPVDGSAAARPLTAGEHRDGRPRWSPAGDRLAFVSHRGSGGSQLYVLPTTGPGELVKVASWPEEIEEVEWSPDGTRLAFTARDRDERRYGEDDDRDRPARRIDRLVYRLDNVGWTIDRPRHLFTVPADGSAPPELVLGGEEVAGLAWSPDGEWLVTASGRHATWDIDLRTDLFRVPVGGDGPEQLTETRHAYGRPSFSPDGDLVACSWWDPDGYPGFTQIAVLDWAAGPAARAADLPRITAPLDRQVVTLVREPVWDGDDLLFVAEDGGNAHLYRVPARGGVPDRVLGGARQITGFDHRAGTLVLVVTGATDLPELVVTTAEGAERSLARPGHRFGARHRLASPQRFTVSSADGAEVEAWIMPPVDHEAGRRHPTLLNIHGGPMTQYGNRLFDEFQIQAGAGFAVLYANPRGSSGYSEAWARAICGPDAATPGSGWGGHDFDDLMAVVDGAVERFDFVDPGRLGVLGGSYGGFMTSWIVGHTDRFAAACSERAVNNQLSMTHTSDIGVRLGLSYLGVSHLDDPDQYMQQSPITYVRDIDTPLLILHSEGDLRCPVEQAEQLFVALRLLGKEVELVRFPGEGHELSRSGAPRHRIERMEIILEWFRRHLDPHC